MVFVEFCPVGDGVTTSVGCKDGEVDGSILFHPESDTSISVDAPAAPKSMFLSPSGASEVVDVRVEVAKDHAVEGKSNSYKVTYAAAPP